MILKENIFYKIFYFLIFIFCAKEIFWAFNYIGPASFFQPNGILSIMPIQYPEFIQLMSITRWLVLLNSLVLIFVNSKSKSGFYLHCLLMVLMTVGIAFRFSFSHYAQLELLPLLAMFGFLFKESIVNKIEIGVKASSLVYFFSGVAKIRYGHWSWLDGETIQQIFSYSVRMRPTMFPAEVILSLPIWFWTTIGALTLLFEILFPLIIYIRSANRIFFISILLFHLSIALVIGIYSTSLLLIIFLYFVRGYVVFQLPTKA